MESFRQREAAETHRALTDEFAFYEAVRNGDVEYVRKNCEDNEFASSVGMGLLSSDSLQNMRYHFIITTALVTRFCAEGGMEPERAYGKSDFYIRKMDKLMLVDDIVNLHHVMVMDYTQEMRQIRELPEISAAVKNAEDYIYLHLHSRITLKELAEYTGLSEGYISKKFKKETGVNISDYITASKIEEAKRLIEFSDMSIVEIANYLAFASQSYFVHVFHKLTGTTPKKYRENLSRKWRSALRKSDGTEA